MEEPKEYTCLEVNAKTKVARVVQRKMVLPPTLDEEACSDCVNSEDLRRLIVYAKAQDWI